MGPPPRSACEAIRADAGKLGMPGLTGLTWEMMLKTTTFSGWKQLKQQHHERTMTGRKSNQPDASYDVTGPCTWTTIYDVSRRGDVKVRETSGRAHVIAINSHTPANDERTVQRSAKEGRKTGRWRWRRMRRVHSDTATCRRDVTIVVPKLRETTHVLCSMLHTLQTVFTNGKHWNRRAIDMIPSLASLVTRN